MHYHHRWIKDVITRISNVAFLVSEPCASFGLLLVTVTEERIDQGRQDTSLEPVEIMDQEIKKLKRRKIAHVKVRWNSKRGLVFTWEHEDQIRIKYPQLFVDQVVELASVGHNLFSEGQFCNGNLEVAFRSNTCYVQNLEGDDLLTGASESNLYTISISDMDASSPVYLMSKATLTKKDPLCSACENGKSKKASHPPKVVSSNHSKLELLHMDLCGPNTW
ncbi:hypothetical protein Tco_0525109 [Tanacetum coccineum]